MHHGLAGAEYIGVVLFLKLDLLKLNAFAFQRLLFNKFIEKGLQSALYHELVLLLGLLGQIGLGFFYLQEDFFCPCCRTSFLQILNRFFQPGCFDFELFGEENQQVNQKIEVQVF